MWTQKGNPRGRTGAGSSTPPSSHPLCPHRLRGAELFRDPGKPLVKPYLQCTPLSQSSQYLPSSCWSSSRKNSTLTIGPSQYCPALRRRKSSAETSLFLLSLHVHSTLVCKTPEDLNAENVHLGSKVQRQLHCLLPLRFRRRIPIRLVPFLLLK